MNGLEAELIVNCHDRLGESPVWNVEEQCLCWADWYGPLIHRLDAKSGRVDHWTLPGARSIGSLLWASGGRLVVGLEHGLHFFDPENGALKPWIDPNAGREGVSYNDAKMDRFGRYWMGTFDIKETEPRGILYCISQDGTWSVGDSGFAVCNGPAFSPDGHTLYFSDSAGKRILAYDVSRDTARLANRRVLVRFDDGEGMPDGLTVDANGDIWCAQYGAGQVGCFAPDGSRRRSVSLPCKAVTSCCFGGPDLSTLYITTGPTSGEPPEANGGGLFACRPGVTGLAEPLLRVTPVR